MHSMEAGKTQESEDYKNPKAGLKPILLWPGLTRLMLLNVTNTTLHLFMTYKRSTTNMSLGLV